MALYLLTKSIEGATITLTNCGASSNEALLARRDLGVLGVDSPSDANTKQITINFGTSTTVDFIVLGNLSISNSGTVQWYYDDSGFTLDDSASHAVISNENYSCVFSQSRTSTQFRIDFVPDASHAVDLSCIFIGERYTAPINYQYNNDRITRMRNEVNYDGRGYPYGQNINPNSKNIWDVVFHMTAAQRTNLQTELENCYYNLRPFMLWDSNVSSEWFLVKYLQDRLGGNNRAYDYFEVPFYVEQL